MKRSAPYLLAALLSSVAFADMPSTPALSRGVAIDITLRDLVGAIGRYAQKPEIEALKRVNEDLTQISMLAADDADETGDAERNPKVDQQLAALQPLIRDVLTAAGSRADRQARLTDLQRQAKQSFIALSLNQRQMQATTPRSIALMNQIEAELAEMNKEEQRATASLYQIMESWKRISEMTAEERQSRGEKPKLAPPMKAGTPGPVAIGVLIALTVVLGVRFVVGEWTHRQVLKPLQTMVRAIEAAIAGDVSAQVPENASEKLGALARAANRLIGVLGRSQRLVYQLSTLVDASSEAIISQDMEGRIVSWNKGAQRIYGYGMDELRGKSVLSLATPETAQELHSMIEAAKRGERVRPTELELEGRNQRPARVILRVAPLLASTKEVTGISFWAQDITGPAPFHQRFPETHQEDASVDQAA